MPANAADDPRPDVTLADDETLRQFIESGHYYGWYITRDDPDGPLGMEVVRRVSTFPLPTGQGIATPATPEES